MSIAKLDDRRVNLGLLVRPSAEWASLYQNFSEVEISREKFRTAVAPRDMIGYTITVRLIAGFRLFQFGDSIDDIIIRIGLNYSSLRFLTPLELCSFRRLYIENRIKVPLVTNEYMINLSDYSFYFFEKDKREEPDLVFKTLRDLRQTGDAQFTIAMTYRFMQPPQLLPAPVSR